MRYSKQREIIHKVVMESCDHPDAYMVHERTKKTISKVSLGTVYRNLNTLSEDGIIKRIRIPNKNDRFDRTISQHGHLYCEACGKVVDIKNYLSDKEIDNIEKQTGFKITDGNFKIKGLCKDCIKK